jgi:hypothetical protein
MEAEFATIFDDLRLLQTARMCHGEYISLPDETLPDRHSFPLVAAAVIVLYDHSRSFHLFDVMQLTMVLVLSFPQEVRLELVTSRMLAHISTQVNLIWVCHTC